MMHTAPEVDILDESSRSQSTLDVANPRALEKAIVYGAGLALPPGDKREDERHDLGN